MYSARGLPYLVFCGSFGPRLVIGILWLILRVYLITNNILMKKIITSLVTLAMVLPYSLVPAVATLIPAVATAASPDYHVKINQPVVSANPLSISGNASSTNYVGQQSAQHLVVNWGDGSANTDVTVPAGTFSGGGFNWNWGPLTHSYTNATTSSFKIIVNICHQTCTGSEGSGDSTDTTIVVVPPQGNLIVKKVVVNDNSGTSTPNKFSFKVNNGTSTPFIQVDSTHGENHLVVAVGNYTITEVAAAGYNTSYSNCTNIAVPLNGSVTCTITNDDVAPTNGTLKVVKLVTNNNGGTKVASDFNLHVKQNNVDVTGSPAVGSTTGKTYTLAGGSYNVSEDSVSGYAGTYSGDCDSNGNVTVVNGGAKICTITNDDVAAKLTVTKVVVNNNGGTATTSTFTLLVGLQSVLSGVQNMFNATTTTVSEQGSAGYTGAISGDCAANGSVTLNLGDVKNCTITNNDNEPSLTLNKIVIDDNDNNGTTPASAWTLTAAGPTGFSGPGPSVSNTPGFSAGIYTLSESGPSGYTASAWSCNGGGILVGNMLTIGLGENVSCTITNNDNPLPVCSNGADDDGDQLIDAQDPGCHSDKDASNPDSYTPNGASEGNETTLQLCTDGQDNDGDGLVDLNDPDCSQFIPKLVINKIVINDDYGTATTSDFSFKVNGGDAISFESDGSNQVTVNPGEYSITEVANSGYTSVLSDDCSGTIAAGETKNCTITNNDKQTKLIVQKVLINDSGKSQATTSFSFIVNGDTENPYVFEADGEDVLIVGPGGYSVSEVSAPGYSTTYGSCSEISLGLGDSATCVITNNDIPACSDNLDNDQDQLIDSHDPGCHSDKDANNPDSYTPNAQSEGNETTLQLCTDGQDNDGDGLVDLNDPDCSAFLPKLTVTKVVVNDNGGTKVVSDFPLYIDGVLASSSVATTSTVGVHAVAEVSDPSYTGSFSGDCDSNGSVTLAAGDNKTCTITNNDNPPAPPVYSQGGYGGGGGGNGPISTFVPNNGGGQVLGQVLGESCGLYMDKHVRLGSSKNNITQVKKLQTFLNKWMKSALPITGFYGSQTYNVALAFQAKYSDEILRPWGESKPTGIIYLSTLRQINNLECPDLALKLPPLVPWSKNPNAQ